MIDIAANIDARGTLEGAGGQGWQDKVLLIHGLLPR